MGADDADRPGRNHDRLWLVGLPAGPLAYAIAAGGAIAIITGFFGFCPMCAMAGRKLPSP